jgi:hypothetical protein
MKNRYLIFIASVLILSCTSKGLDDTGKVIESIIENELASDIDVNKKTYIYFLQNAECKCSEETLDQIRDFDQTKGKLLVIVNKHSHFSVKRLQKVEENLRYISINTLLSYGFIQDKDILVELEKNKLIYTNL